MEILDRATGERLNQKEQTGVFPEPQNFRGRFPFKKFLRTGLALSVIMTVAQVVEKVNTALADGPQPTAISEMAPKVFLPTVTKDAPPYSPIRRIADPESVKAVDWIIGVGEPVNVPQEWLKQNPQNILVAADFKDQNGQVSRQAVVTNNTYNKQTGYYEGNSTLYVNDCNTTTGECFAYRPVMELPAQNVRSFLFITADEFYEGGEKTLRNWDTTLRKCSVVTSSCGPELWTYGFSGPVIDLLQIDNEYILGNNGNHLGVEQFILRTSLTTEASRVQAVIDEITRTNLPGAGSPRISNIDTNAKTIQFYSSALGRLYPGIDRYSINYTTASGRVDNFLGDKVGGVDGMVEYTDTTGKHLLVSNGGAQFIAGADLDSSGNPMLNGYKIYTNDWLNKQITNIEPGSFGTSCLGTFIDAASNVHILTDGVYRTLNTPQQVSRNHEVAVQFIKGANPSIDPSDWSWSSLTPDSINAMGCQQKEMRSRIVNGRLTFEWPLRSNDFDFGGIVSVSSELVVSYPNAGLDKKLPVLPPTTRTIYLPSLTRSYAGAW